MTVAISLNVRGEDGGTATRINVVALFLFGASALGGLLVTLLSANPVWVIGGALVGFVLAQSPRVASQWERVVLLRLGKYVGLRGPGLFWIVPFIEAPTAYIDQRVITTGFAAEQTLTADTVPVNVDAVLFWMVHDAEKAALEVQNYRYTVSWAAQTALRDIIGKTSLSDLLQATHRGWVQKRPTRPNPWG
jgi:regulator of protease activity HflC (stomatin/prohibitin superfamily)